MCFCIYVPDVLTFLHTKRTLQSLPDETIRRITVDDTKGSDLSIRVFRLSCTYKVVLYVGAVLTDFYRKHTTSLF